MPPLCCVISLQILAQRRLAVAVAEAVYSCVLMLHSDAGETKAKKKHAKRSSCNTPSLFQPERELQKIQNYLRNARPKRSKQNLFNEMLNDLTRLLTHAIVPRKRISYEAEFLKAVRNFEIGLGYAFVLFLDSDIKSLDLTNVQHLSMNWVDSCRLSNKDPSAERQLNHGQIEGAMLRTLSRNAGKLQTIESLTWPHLVSGELLRIIGEHMFALQYLTLACECQVVGRDEDIDTFTLMTANNSWEDDLVQSLISLYGRGPGNFSVASKEGYVAGCPQLKKLILPRFEDETGAAASCIANALTNLPALEYIYGVPVMAALMKLKSKTSVKGHPLNLKNIFDHDVFMRRPMPDEEFLKEMLPKLESIEIYASLEITRRLALAFNQVTTLKVEWPDFENYTKKFPHLVNLELTLNYRVVWQLLRNIGFHCRGIRNLILNQPTFAVSDDHEEGVSPPKLPTLENFKLVRSSYIEFTAFKHFIIGCPNLKVIFLTLTNDRNYIVDELGDPLIRNIIPYLKNLESFTVESLYRYNLCMHLNCILSLNTVKELINGCPKLSYIGHLDSWDVVDKEVEDLQQEIKSRNLDIVIQ